MRLHEIDGNVGYWVLSAAHIFQRAINEQLAPHGITYRQCQVLGCLIVCGDTPQSQLAEMLQIEPSTLVRVLDRMERDGWISRHDCPGDRRKKLIRTTDRVEPVWSKIVACGESIQQRATEGMEARDVELLKNLLARLQNNLNEESLAEAGSMGHG